MDYLKRVEREEKMTKKMTMKQIAELREKYDLHMTVERFLSDEYEADQLFVRQ